MLIENVMRVIDSLNFLTVVAVILLSALFFVMFSFAKKNNSSYLIVFTAITLAVLTILKLLSVPVITEILTIIAVLIPILFFIFFRQELKREVWKRSRRDKVGEIAVKRFTGSEYEIRECIGIIIKALQSMSKKNVGALVVIVPSTIPMQIAESGVMVNADLSVEIIENIFTPNTPLHDGAMLITGNKILASGCFLPLTQDNALPKDLGTRHRAGIGITEMTDVLALVVSEETGIISFARRGTLTRYAGVAELTDQLEQIYGVKESAQ